MIPSCVMRRHCRLCISFLLIPLGRPIIIRWCMKVSRVHAQGVPWLSSGHCDLQYTVLKPMLPRCRIMLPSLFPFVEDWCVASSFAGEQKGNPFPFRICLSWSICNARDANYQSRSSLQFPLLCLKHGERSSFAERRHPVFQVYCLSAELSLNIFCCCCSRMSFTMLRKSVVASWFFSQECLDDTMSSHSSWV